MGIEIEIKLTLEQKSVDAVFQLPLIAEYALQAIKKKSLFTQYYDTDDYLLWRHGTALRLRHDGQRFVQTLKQKGESVDGLSKRNEWEWSLNDASLDLSLVPAGIWPRVVRNRLQALQPIFNTEFKRFLWLLAFPKNCFYDGQSAATVEMVLDQGKIEANTATGVKTEPILEIELELKKGVSKTLVCLSRKIAQFLPVRPSDVSKAERGYRLLGLVHADDR